MKVIYMFTSVIFATLAFADSQAVITSRSIFPEFMLSQYHNGRTAGNLTTDQLNKGEISIFRYAYRSFPEKTILAELNADDDKEGVRNRFGYSIAEIREMWAAANTPDKQKLAREKIGKTPNEVAAYFARNTPSLTDETRNTYFKTEQKLLKKDLQSDEIEIFLIVPYSAEKIEKAYRNFERWPTYHGFYLDSRLLTQANFDSLCTSVSIKFCNLKSNDTTWYHYYKTQILLIEWSGVSKFQRFAETIKVKDLYPGLPNITQEVKRVTLEWNLEDLFDPEVEEESESSAENPFLNDNVDAASGHLILEEFVDSSGKVDSSKTIVLLKTQFRILDGNITQVPEQIRKNTTEGFAKSFLEGLRKQL